MDQQDDRPAQGSASFSTTVQFTGSTGRTNTMAALTCSMRVQSWASGMAVEGRRTGSTLTIYWRYENGLRPAPAPSLDRIDGSPMPLLGQHSFQRDGRTTAP